MSATANAPLIMPDVAPDGILPCQELDALILAGGVRAPGGVGADQVQPASIDLRLGARAWRVRASFLPRLGLAVRDRLPDVAMHELDLAGGAVLEKGCVYIAEVRESLALPPDIEGRANPKSSTGRVDLFVRLLTDGQPAFDNVASGYKGPMYLEIAPQTFSVLVRSGTRLNQLRLRRGAPRLLASTRVGVQLADGVVGFRARRHAGVIDMDLEGELDPRDFWDRLEPRRGELLLDPGEFYILASKTHLEIPVSQAAEMTPIDPAVGEFRVHYAGFFDPGFGVEEAGGAGSRGVLEVRSRETPFLLEDGQTVAKLVFEPLTAPAARPYGRDGSHYQRQGLKLSKHFKAWR
jgi:dCTP deaminase